MISQCPSCKKQIEVPEAAVGKKVRCTGCQAVFVVAPNSPAPPLKAKTPDASAAESLDVLEEIPEDAPATVPKKKESAEKKASPPAGDPDNPFSFEGPSPLAGAVAADDPRSSLDFNAEQPKLNAGIRMRIAGAGRMMMIGSAMTLVLAIVMVVRALFAGGNFAAMIGGFVAAALVYVVAIVIFLCARSLQSLRSRALGVTAAVLCLLVSLAGLSSGIMALILLIAGSGGGADSVVMLLAVILGFVSLAQFVNCVWGGITTLIFIFRADVGDAIRESLDREASVAATSTTLVPDSCRRGARWQALAVMLNFLNILLYGGILGFLFWKPQRGDPTGSKIFIGVVIFFFSVLLVLNLGGTVALFMRRFFVVGMAGGVACLVAAVLSFFGGIAELPLVLVAIVSRDPIFLSLAIAILIFTLLLNVVGLLGFTTAMDAARLLRKYGSGPTKAVPEA